MWRAFFLGIGITLCLLGFECLVVDHAVLAGQQRSTSIDDFSNLDFSDTGDSRILEPPEWAPWSCLSGGAVLTLYALLLKKEGGD